METTWPCFNIDSQAEHSWEKAHVVWDQLGIVYYELLKPNETITGALYRTQLMRLSRALKKKRAHYYSTKLFFCMIMLVHMLRRRSKSTWKHSIGKFYPTRRIHQTLLLLITACFDRWRMVCLSNTSHHMKIPKIGSIRG